MKQSSLDRCLRCGFRVYAIDTTNPIRSSAAFGSHTLKPGVPLHVEPEKPEPDWAPIAHTEVERLQRAGARVQYKMVGDDDEWITRESLRYAGISLECEYQVDRNTVPAGVSIEPEKQSPKWRHCSREFALMHKNTSRYRVRVDDGHQWSWGKWEPMTYRYGANQNGEEFQTMEPEETPQWRTCSKEFALAHPETSQARYRDGVRWKNWASTDTNSYWDDPSHYEFRTTSPEPKPEPDRITSYAFMMRLIMSPRPIFAKTPRSPFATGRWFLFETSVGFKSGAAKDACTVNLDMHLFFAQEWFEVES